MTTRQTRDLLDAIKACLTDLPTVPWLPKLTTELVEKGWETLHRRTGISVLDYGTTRVLAGESKASRHVVDRLLMRRDRNDSMTQILIEVLTGNAIPRYRSMDLVFYTPDEMMHTGVIDCLEEAIDLLRHVPTLQETVAALVRSCHLLKAADDDYDVSHSDPQVPFSIFVSVPQKRLPHDSLRVVESIVHEAMHLQLTLIERVLPLVHPSHHRYFSPWKGAYRSPAGVLHALYVFRVIDRFLEHLRAFDVWSAASMGYMQNRRDDIARQIAEIETFKDCPALTRCGVDVVRRLMAV